MQNRRFEDEDTLYALLGRVVVEWSQTEGRARRLLHEIMGSASDTNYILLAHLGNVAITDAIKAYSEACPKALADHLKHYCTYFDRLREHRNHYVHGILLVGTEYKEREATAVGETQQITARGRLCIAESKVRSDDLRALISSMTELACYDSVLRWEINGNRPQGAIALTPQRKPPLPDTIQKTRLFPIAEAHLAQGPQ